MKTWGKIIGDYEVVVQSLPSGEWLATMGLKQVLDRSGRTNKQEVFANVSDALKWVGYPVGVLPIPRELE